MEHKLSLENMNGLCPSVSHGHRIANDKEIKSIKEHNPKILHDNSICIYCNQSLNIKLYHPVNCKNYKKTIIEDLTKLQYIYLERLLDIYGIPIELRLIIYGYCKIEKVSNCLDYLNSDTFKHMVYCKTCAPTLIENLTLNTCISHIIPREILINDFPIINMF